MVEFFGIFFHERMTSAVVGTAFVVLWALLVLVNLISLYRAHIKKESASPVPILGGLFGVIGFSQIPRLRKWWWVAVLSDYGSIVFFIALPKIVKELWQTSRINLVRELLGCRGKKRVRIRLYRSGVFVIEQDIGRDKEEQGLIRRSDIGNWQKKDGMIVFILNDDTMEMVQTGGTWKVERSFSCYEQHRDLGIKDMEFKETLPALSLVAKGFFISCFSVFCRVF